MRHFCLSVPLLSLALLFGAEGAQAHCGSTPTPSFLFNTQEIDFVYSVNSGDDVRLPGTSKQSKWWPIASQTGFDPLCRTRGNLWWGTNMVTVNMTQGDWSRLIFSFSIPASVNVQAQFQLYVLWSGFTNFKLLILREGLFFALLDPS